MRTLPLHVELSTSSRLSDLLSRKEAAGLQDWACLIASGMIAAIASVYMDFGLRFPGHAILRVIFPMSVGLALVPRRGAGTVMCGSALITAMGLRMGGLAGSGLGALTSLAAMGPVLDWTLSRSVGKTRLHLSFALAGLFANFCAFSVRGLSKVLIWENAGRRPLFEWLPIAIVTYTVSGLVAGYLSGVILFASRKEKYQPSKEAEESC